MERNDSILGGALLLTAANLLLRLISIAFQVFLSVRIGAAGLGLMQLISTIGVFAKLAGTAGVRETAMYLAAEEFGHRRLSGVRAAMRACLQYGILVSAVSGAALAIGTVETETMAFSSGRAPSAVVTSTRSSAVPSVDAVMENLLVSGWKNRYNKGDKL